jgi:hypothetical protein
VVCFIPSQDLDIALVVIVEVGEDASAGSGSTANSGTDANGRMENVGQFAVDFAGGDEVFIAVCAEDQVGC